MITDTLEDEAQPADARRLAVFWFGLQAVWGAVLGLALQGRILALSPAHALAAFGVISTVGALLAGVVQLAVGPRSDARRIVGSRRLTYYVVGSAVAAMALIAFFLAPSIVMLAAAFLILEVGMNLAIGPYQAIIPDFMPRERFGIASGWMAAAQSAGNASGAIVATLLANTPMLGIVLAAMLGMTCAYTVAHVRSKALQPIERVEPLKLTRSLIDLSISRALVYLGFYTLLGYFFFYVASLMRSNDTKSVTLISGIAILVFTLIGVAGAAIAARPADRSDERAVVSLGGGCLALALFALAITGNWYVVGAAIVVAGTGWGVFLVADWAFACRVVPTSALATSMAAWNVAVIVPQVLAPLVVSGVLIALGALHSADGPRIAMIVASLEIVLGSWWIWRLPRQARGK